MSESVKIAIEQIDTKPQPIDVYPRTADDTEVEALTTAATDEQFAQFSPRSAAEDEAAMRLEPGLKRTLGRAGVQAANTVELVGGGRSSMYRHSIVRRNERRAKWGINPENHGILPEK